MRRFQRTSGFAEQPQARIRLSPWDEPRSDEGPRVPGELFPQTPLRRRWFGGYRHEDVQLLLTECRMMLRQLERKLEPLRERERDLQAEASVLRVELRSEERRVGKEC